MADRTPIEWTDATWNPVRGCSRVSEGCRNCYAEIMAARFSGPGQWGEGLAEIVGEGLRRDHRWTGKVALAGGLLDQPLRWRRPRRIFVNSTSDLFHEAIPDDWIDRVFAVMALAPQHTFQVLTKRPERMREYFMHDDGFGRWGYIEHFAREMLTKMGKAQPQRKTLAHHGGSNMPHVWLGVSVEDQATADARIPPLLATPAAKRFISAEPLLGPVDVSPYLYIYTHADDAQLECGPCTDEPLPFNDPETTPFDAISTPRLDWVIAGGESGPGARPMHPDWPRALRDQCAAAGVPFFFKQWGEWGPDEEPPAKGRDRIMEGKAPCATLGADGWTYHPGGFTPDPFEGRGRWLYRLGKKATGAALDGREHRGFPA